jgi:hypothetical protein
VWWDAAMPTNPDDNASGFLSHPRFEGDKRVKKKNCKFIRRHVANPLHKINVQLAAAKDQGKTGDDLQKEMLRPDGAFASFYASTTNLFKAVFAAVKMRISFSSFKILTDLLQNLGVSIGSLFQNPTGMYNIVRLWGWGIREDFKSYLLREQPKVTIILDTSVDIAGNDLLVVIFHLVDSNFRLKVVLYRYIVITDGTADGLFKAIKKAIEDDGLYEYLKNNMVGYVTDGASVVRIALKDKFVKWLQPEVEDREAANFFPSWYDLNTYLTEVLRLNYTG